MRIAVYGSRHQEAYLGFIEEFFKALAAAGVEAVVHSKLYHYLLHLMPAALEAVKRVTDATDFSADVAVSIGGDGSFLRTSAWVGDKEIPILGVNTGHLGYLTSLPVEKLPQLPHILASGSCTVENRSLIAVECEGVGGWPYALNEVAISKSDGASILEINAMIDSMPLADYRADGLIISTPTGSTAYNLSLGGPIVQPSAPVFVLSPNAAHSLSMRPLVVADTSVLKFVCDGRSRQFRIAIDGRSYAVDNGTVVTLRRAPFVTKVMMTDGANFAQTLRNKLSWS